MPRQHRIQVPGGIYHVNTKGCAERFIFLDDIDRASFEEILALVVRKHDWSCSSFCLMGTHYHLIVETTRLKLSAGFHHLNGKYAQAFNRRYQRRLLAQNRFATKLANKRLRNNYPNTAFTYRSRA